MKRGGGGADNWRGKYLQKIGAVTTVPFNNDPHINSSSSLSSSSVTATQGEGQLITTSISALSSVAASLPIQKGSTSNNNNNVDSSSSSLLINGGVNPLSGDSVSGSGLAISLPYDDSRSTPDARTPVSPIPTDEPDPNAQISSLDMLPSVNSRGVRLSNGRGGGGGGRGGGGGGGGDGGGGVGGAPIRRSAGNIDDSDIFGYGLELSSGGVGGSRAGVSQSNRGGVGGGGGGGGLQHRLSMQSSTEYGEGDSGSQDGSQRESDRLSDTTGSSIPHEGSVWGGLPGAQRVVHNDNLSGVNAVHWRSQLELQKQRLLQSELDTVDSSLDNSLPEAPAPINALAAAASLQKKKIKKGGGGGGRAEATTVSIESAMASLTFSGVTSSPPQNIKEEMVTLPPPVPLMGLSLEGKSISSKPLLGLVGGGQHLVGLDEVEESEEEG